MNFNFSSLYFTRKEGKYLKQATACIRLGLRQIKPASSLII